MTNYDNFAKTFSESRKNMKWAELDAILEDIWKNHFTKILDIGAGSGRFLQHFFETFWHFPEAYLGVDASENMILEAKKNFPEQNFSVATMQDFFENFEDSEKFDAIIFLASFHHLDNENDRIAVLKNAKNFLSEAGKIFLTNWNLLEQEKYQKSHTGNGDFQIKIWEFSRYYHGFSTEELEKIFEKAEVKIVENRVFDGGRNIFSVLKK